MKVLIVEDEEGFITKLTAALRASAPDVELLLPAAAGLDKKFDTTASHEEQMLARARTLQEENQVDVVLLDSDLSRMSTGITQSLCRQVFQEVGIPVCRYKKKHSATNATRLQDLHRLAREGASAVWVPSDFLQSDKLASQLVPWLLAVEQGFSELRKAIEEKPDLLTMPLGPAGILASVLGRASLKGDLLGYTAQNFFFFGPPTGEDEEDPARPTTAVAQATRLGYWLVNYILTFPGPILSTKAAAAYLNLQPSAFENEVVERMVRPARYDGPFRNVEQYYWREDLAVLLEGYGGDIASAPELKELGLARVDEEDPGSSAYLCVLTQEPIAQDEAAPNPDWIPAGAQLARVQSKLYDQLGPMLSF